MKHRTLAIVCFGLATMLVSSMAEAQYQRKNLVSNQVKQAAHTDPLLVKWLGARAWPGHTVVDQRQQLRMGHVVRRLWQTSHKAQGIDSYSGKWAKFTDRIERPGIANGNCF